MLWQSSTRRILFNALLAVGLHLNAGAESLSGYPDSLAVPVLDLDALSDTSSGPVPYPGPVAPSNPMTPADPIGTKDTATPVASAPDDGNGMAAEKGLILSAETGKPVPQALILLIGRTDRYSCQSDKDGIYGFSGVKPGEYRLKAGKRGFAFHEKDGLVLGAGGNPFREIRLERSVLKGQLIAAKGGGNTSSAAAMMASRRSNAGVMEGVGAEQIAKSADSDAGAVAKRITGTSLVGGKYIYVRGLGERYTNMTLNGLPVPSPEKDKRVVPQDLFPASALERFVLYKTFSPELNGDFAGGSVALETKGIPERRFLKISVGSGGTDYKGDGSFLNFGDKRLAYKGGNTFLGFDDGTRTLPEGFPDRIPRINDDQVAQYRKAGFTAFSTEERARLAMAFPNVHSFDTAAVRPSQNYSLSFGDVRRATEESRAGYLLSLGFKNRYNQKNRVLKLLGTAPITQAVTRFNPRLGKDITVQESVKDTLPEMETIKKADGGDTLVNKVVDVERLQYGIDRQANTGTYEATATGLANFGWVLNADHNLFWKNLYANLATDEANFTRSVVLPTNTGVTQDKPVEDRYLLEFNRRGLYTTQLGGGHYLGTGALDSLSWVAGFSWTRGETPDSRRHLYSRANDSAGEFEYRNNDVWGTRIFENLVETALAGRMDAALSIPPAWSARDTFLAEGKTFSRLKLPEARTGFSANYRSRSFAVTRYAYDGDPNTYTNIYLEQIRDPASLKGNIEAGKSDFTTSPKEYDEYSAKEGAYGGYVSTGTSFRAGPLPVDVEGGLRAEGYTLRLLAPFTGQSKGIDRAAIDSLAKRVAADRLDFLPSAGLSIHPYRGGKIHLHYAHTLARPEFREIAPYRFTDYLTGRDVYGNPNLRQTLVRHWDLRWEWYFPGSQLLSVSLFHKDFKDPVEIVSDTDKRMSYQNAKGAYVRGVEFEGNLDLELALGAAGVRHGAFKGWTVYGNLALMESKVSLDTSHGAEGEIGAGELNSRVRPLTGQSPYLLNLRLGHEREWRRWGILNALLFNVSGERIREVGVGNAPDIYEQPFPALDYMGRVTLFRTTEIAWTVKNLLAEDKRMRGYEYNAGKRYHTADPAFVASTFAGLPSSYDTEVTQEGTSYEIKISYGF